MFLTKLISTSSNQSLIIWYDANYKWKQTRQREQSSENAAGNTQGVPVWTSLDKELWMQNQAFTTIILTVGHGCGTICHMTNLYRTFISYFLNWWCKNMVWQSYINHKYQPNSYKLTLYTGAHIQQCACTIAYNQLTEKCTKQRILVIFKIILQYKQQDSSISVTKMLVWCMHVLTKSEAHNTLQQGFF